MGNEPGPKFDGHQTHLKAMCLVGFHAVMLRISTSVTKLIFSVEREANVYCDLAEGIWLLDRGIDVELRKSGQLA